MQTIEVVGRRVPKKYSVFYLTLRFHYSTSNLFTTVNSRLVRTIIYSQLFTYDSCLRLIATLLMFRSQSFSDGILCTDETVGKTVVLYGLVPLYDAREKNREEQNCI